MHKTQSKDQILIRLSPDQYAAFERAMQWPEDLASYDMAQQGQIHVQPETPTKLKTQSDKRPRDSQRSKVYAWERCAVRNLSGRDFYAPEFDSLVQCEAFALPMWSAECGRFGLIGIDAPKIVRPARGQRKAKAHFDHRISLPKWSRSRWIILHELVHRLNASAESMPEAHGQNSSAFLLVWLLVGWVTTERHYGRWPLKWAFDTELTAHNLRCQSLLCCYC